MWGTLQLLPNNHGRHTNVIGRRRGRLKCTQRGRATVWANTNVAGLEAPTRLLAAEKPHAGQLVVGWVTTSESWLL
ncbi:hypothetical protein FE257_003506 [Aspergillus nanangensis]|uniref:Uncharacterized protein n=1 Tax=Aspergillus nanangensis TaxID=2582783 RepID=A0AAD4GPJ9_ASPNN|nr:hypothetical protein FE257_003506 [Aspergillus nanangensis]